MSLVSYKGVSISGLAAAVPRNIIDNQTNINNIFTNTERENTISTTGIKFRRIADKDICSSDLCFVAADRLLNSMNCDRSSIDLLIFVSQTPDYRQPATAPILQYRLGLSKNTGAFDINLACSGYIYGLSTAFAYCSMKNVHKVLLLVGETLSKIISFEDRATSMLFGDGGTATLIEKDNKGKESFFSLNSDGSGYNVLIIEGGGYRHPSSPETLSLQEYPDGSKRTQENLKMDGMEVFNFTMREVPNDIKKIMKFADIKEKDISYFIFHQANKMMTEFFMKKLQFPSEKAVYSLDIFGNTSAVSIPLTMVSEIKKDLQRKELVLLLSGFGGGLSWGSAIIYTNQICVPEIIEI